MRYITILTLLLIVNWTALYGQTGKDTVTCYNNAELQKIALKVVLANELDTLYKLNQKELANKDSIISKNDLIISNKTSIIASKDSIISKHDEIIELKNDKIKELDEEVDKLNNHKKWLKTGWVASVAVMIVTMLLSSI